MSKWVVIGNPENRRIRYFRQALEYHGQGEPVVISYQWFLEGPDRLAEVISPGAIVRLESPGENVAVERLLWIWGAEAAAEAGVPCLPAEVAAEFEPEFGQILYPYQRYLGFCQAIRCIASQVAAVPGGRLTADPEEVAVMFDKQLTDQQLQAAGVPVPQSLGAIHSYEHLRQRMVQTRMRSVFVKLRHSSSASGIVALTTHSRGQVAITTAELMAPAANSPPGSGSVRLFNCLRLREYHDEKQVALLIDELARQGAIAQRWVSKAAQDGLGFDLRVVCIAGTPQHSVVRASRSPMTNLHLGNRRGDLAALQDRLGDQRWQTLQEFCSQAAAVFPRSLHCGLDVCLQPNLRQQVVFEVNAFGDLLPGILHGGVDTYTAEVAAVLEGRWPVGS